MVRSKVDNGEKYDFLSVFDEKEERYTSKTCYTQQWSMNSTLHLSFSSSRSSSSGSPPSPPWKMRSLDDMYEVINLIDDDLILYCHLDTCEPIVFEKAIKNRE